PSVTPAPPPPAPTADTSAPVGDRDPENSLFENDVPAPFAVPTDMRAGAGGAGAAGEVPA
ncbi:hypothetical protein C5B96_00035, partial [Subtercola sp. Z020]